MGNCFGIPEHSISPVIERPPNPGRSMGGDRSGADEANANLRVFTFKELKRATNGFKATNRIGDGGCGEVYKGWVNETTLNPAKEGSGMTVAVKKWKQESYFGAREWQTEVNILGRLSHPNLIKLLGCCCEDDQLLLVYEFMANRSLKDHLYTRGDDALQPLSLEHRLKIAAGAARALAFLHTAENSIIHRDFKPSHVLLDSDFNPKISDLGLAKTGPVDADSHVSTRVMGTYGYAAPEYIATGHLNAKADVYGFGVMLLEMLSGKRAVDILKGLNGKKGLADFARQYLKSCPELASNVVDSRSSDYPPEATRAVGQLAGQCLADDPKSRPTMDAVVQTLEQIQGMKHTEK